MLSCNVSARTLMVGFAWFLPALATFALLSPPGASRDEWQHLASAWCGQGERVPYCSDIREVADSRSATVNFAAADCDAASDVLYWCSAVEGSKARLEIQTQGPAKGFYYVFSWLASSSIERSVVTMRFANAIIASVLLSTLALLLPGRHRVVLIMTLCSILSVSGYFLLASLNPASWSVLGIGVGWLALHAVGTSSDLSVNRRGALMALGGVFVAMSLVGARYGAYSLVVVALLIAGDSAVCRWIKPNNLSVKIAFVPMVLTLLVLGTLKIFPDRILLSYPSVASGLRTVPTSSPIRLPIVVLIVSLALVTLLLAATFNRASIMQTLGTFTAITAATLVIVKNTEQETEAFRSLIDVFGATSPDPQMSFPLVVFAVSWWLLHGPQDLLRRVDTHLRKMLFASLIVHTLVSFTIAERFIDRQKFGLRVLPDGPDDWWWRALPIPPSVVLVLSVAFVWRFFDGMSRFLGLAPRLRGD